LDDSIDKSITDLFQIDPENGQIHLAKELDHEMAQRLRIKIGVISKEGREGICVLEVRVIDQNDNPPRFGHILSLVSHVDALIKLSYFKLKVNFN
jgi:hypothetical protein